MQPNGPPQTSLIEIGPRFVLTPIRIFEGAFSGATVFSNPGEHPLPFVPRMAMLRVLYMLALSRYTFLRFFDIVLWSLVLSPTNTPSPRIRIPSICESGDSQGKGRQVPQPQGRGGGAGPPEGVAQARGGRVGGLQGVCLAVCTLCYTLYISVLRMVDSTLMPLIAPLTEA